MTTRHLRSSTTQHGGRLTVAVVHGRGWTTHRDRKRQGVSVAVQQALSEADATASLDALEIQLIEYDDVLSRSASQRSRQATHSPVIGRSARVAKGVHDTSCPCCPPLDPVDSLYARVLRIGSRSLHLTKLVIGTRFADDVHRYLQDPAVRMDVIRHVVGRVEDVEPDVVIAHSLGTIVILDALASMTSWQPTALITLGAPLGLPWVRRDLPEAAQAWLTMPQSAWLNVYDPTDEVTGGAPICDQRPGDRPYAVLNLQVNNDRGTITNSVAHDLKAYLGHPLLGQWLAALAESGERTPRGAQGLLKDLVVDHVAPTEVSPGLS